MVAAREPPVFVCETAEAAVGQIDGRLDARAIGLGGAAPVALPEFAGVRFGFNQQDALRAVNGAGARNVPVWRPRRSLGGREPPILQLTADVDTQGLPLVEFDLRHVGRTERSPMIVPTDDDAGQVHELREPLGDDRRVPFGQEDATGTAPLRVLAEFRAPCHERPLMQMTSHDPLRVPILPCCTQFGTCQGCPTLCEPKAVMSPFSKVKMSPFV